MFKHVKRPTLLIFCLFIFLHALFMHINVAEWGDSYRILRASEYIRHLTYPDDEKRPPLYSALLALRPLGIEQIEWGKLFMLGVSVIFFWTFYAFISLYTENKRIKLLSLLFFTLNPVLFYWSIRIYADVFFALLALITLFLVKKTTSTFKWYYAVLLGLVCGLAVLTRFEGYLLTLSAAAGLFLCNVSDLKKAVKRVLREKWVLLCFFVSFLLVELPYMFIRNPFTSQYFDETSQRGITVENLGIFGVSLLFVFGITTAFSFFMINFREIPRILRMNVSLFLFLLLELTLSLLWPAAIPRLLVPVIPFMCVFLATSITKYFDMPNQKSAKQVLLSSVLLILLFGLAQFVFKLQFLVSIKYLFITVLAFQLPLLYFTYKYKFKFFVLFSSLSMIIWLFASIWVHKDIYATVKHASDFASKNLQGVVGFNDVSSVSDWYLNYSEGRTVKSGVFYNYSKKSDLGLSKLQEKNLDYLILTNEHNTSTKLDLETRPYLQLVETFAATINGKEFWTLVLKISSN